MKGNMSGLFGKAPLTSDIGLLLEIGVIATLLIGRFIFARKGKVTSHGYTLTIAIVLHAISVLSIMIPSFARSTDILFTDFFSPAIILTWIHAPLGLLVLILGAYLVLEWRFKPPQDTCYKRVKLMRPLWLLWMLSLAMGILIYLSIAIY
jgi:uncharacterized membrane protein YozB (DUF420 family)